MSEAKQSAFSTDLLLPGNDVGKHEEVSSRVVALKEFGIRMKTTNNTKPLWANAEQMENLRKALRKRLWHEELDNSWRLDALTALLQVDPVTLHVCWIQPLLAEGVSMEVAITCVAESYLLPN